MSKKPNVTEKDFDTVKFLTKGGAKLTECAKCAGLSTATVSRIRAAKTWEEYKRAKVTKPTPVQKPEPKPEPVMNPTVVRVEATHYMMQEIQKTNEYLKSISAKLAFVIDELCGTAKKEG